MFTSVSTQPLPPPLIFLPLWSRSCHHFQALQIGSSRLNTGRNSKGKWREKKKSELWRQIVRDLHVLKHWWHWSKKKTTTQYVISPEWDLLPVPELTLGIATNTAILYMHAKINNAQFGIGFTLKRSDLIKPQPPDNKRAVCIIPQMLPLPSWGNWFHGCSPRMLLNIWHLGIWKHIDVLLHVHRSLIETVKLFTVCRSHLFGGNHIFCQPAAVLINAGFL